MDFDLKADPMREKLAALCHEQWSGWMKYLFSKCPDYTETGATIINPDYENRWVRQMETPYAELSEAEKDSDRKEADRFLAILSAGLAEREKLEAVGKFWKDATRQMGTHAEHIIQEAFQFRLKDDDLRKAIEKYDELVRDLKDKAAALDGVKDGGR